MWGFIWLKLKRVIWLVVVVRLTRMAVRALAHWLEKRNHGATTTSRALIWAGDALPRSGRRAPAKA